MKLPRILYVASGAVFACVFLFPSGSLAASGGAAPQGGSSRPMPALGSAPLMKFKILNQSAQETTYAVIFGAGDEILGGLTQVRGRKPYFRRQNYRHRVDPQCDLGVAESGNEKVSHDPHRSAGGSALTAGRRRDVSGKTGGACAHGGRFRRWHGARRTPAAGARLAHAGSDRHGISATAL